MLITAAVRIEDSLVLFGGLKTIFIKIHVTLSSAGFLFYFCSFITLLSVLLQCGTNHPSRVLQFCQFVSELLDRNAEFLPGPEVLWRLWSIVAHTVQEHISKVGICEESKITVNFSLLIIIK